MSPFHVWRPLCLSVWLLGPSVEEEITLKRLSMHVDIFRIGLLEIVEYRRFGLSLVGRGCQRAPHIVQLLSEAAGEFEEGRCAGFLLSYLAGERERVGPCALLFFRVFAS